MRFDINAVARPVAVPETPVPDVPVPAKPAARRSGGRGIGPALKALLDSCGGVEGLLAASEEELEEMCALAGAEMARLALDPSPAPHPEAQARPRKRKRRLNF